MATAWTKLVTETFKKNRKTNKNYKFKDALVDAKKLYRSSSRSMGTAVVGKVTKTLRKTMKGRGRKYGGSKCDEIENVEERKQCVDAVAEEEEKARLANGSNDANGSNGSTGANANDVNNKGDNQENSLEATDANENDVNNGSVHTNEQPPTEQFKGGRRRKTSKRAKRSKRNTKH
jgi:hypothetical protein